MKLNTLWLATGFCYGAGLIGVQVATPYAWLIVLALIGTIVGVLLECEQTLYDRGHKNDKT